jgi:Cytochrome c554 and c-prime
MRWKPALLPLGAALAAVPFLSSVASEPIQNAHRSASTDQSQRWVSAKFQGVSSCAAASCHGGVGPPGVDGCELTTWAVADKHANAYRVLFSERSQVMLWNYRHLDSIAQARPHRDTECLNCHSLAPPAELRGNAPRQPQLADGVGCENCHGPAEHWLTVHYLNDWKQLDPRAKERYGMLPTKDLAARISQCATCHVGREGQEVNHDLIAAGHPRLRFEYTVYQRNMPPHWREKAYGPDFEVRAWAIGQVASARAAVELLRSRAERALKDRAPWPELSEYSCYSCHHNLRPQGPRPANGRPGSLVWSTWYTPLLESLAAASAPLTASGQVPSTAALKELRKLLTDHPGAGLTEVRTKAQAAARELGSWLDDLQEGAYRDSFTKPLAASRVKELARTMLATPADREWDGATQRYLALKALLPDRRDFRDPMLRLRGELRFAPGYDSPHSFSPAAYADELRQLREALESSGERP